jgi:hypothetical protein
VPYPKRLELGRRDPAGRYASLAGIQLALEGAALIRGSVVAADTLRFPADGKPYFVGGPFFSVSHGVQRVAVALSEDVDVGFDLEEIGLAQPGAADPRASLERWTATEAVLKAAGRGLRDACSVELDGPLATGMVAGIVFQVRPVAIAPDVVAHLAARVAIETVTVRTVDLPRHAG